MKKYIKRIIPFISIFCIISSFFVITSFASETNNDSLKFVLYSSPIIKKYNDTTGNWDNIDFGTPTFTSINNDQEKSISMTVDNYNGYFEQYKYYRIFFRFRLDGDFTHDTAVKFGFRLYSSSSNSLGIGNGEYNPSAFVPSDNLPNDTFGTIWYSDEDYSGVHDSASITPYSVVQYGYTCNGYKYAYPVPSYDYDIKAYQISFAFNMTSNQNNRVEFIMEDFNFPITLPDFSDTAFNDFSNIENDIISGTNEGRGSAVNIFNTFASDISNLSIGIMAVGSLLNEFFQITAFSSVINISLALGLFAFVVGMSVIVVRNVRPNDKFEIKGFRGD